MRMNRLEEPIAGLLLRLADKIRCQIRIACALVNGHLRIRTEGTAHVDSIVAHTIGRHLIRSFAPFAPGFYGRNGGELVRSWSAAAVIHSWDHKQAKPVFLMRAHFGEHAGVVVHAVQW